ncbi:MAG: glycosyltransferase [Thermomicrobiales bacterium]
MTRRVAFISEHASPLALLGGIDAGGQNVYVDAVSRHLPEHGYAVDVFTVWNDPAQPQVTELAPGVCVVNIAVADGPREKDALWPLMPAFRDGIARFAAAAGQPYDLIHGNFWMSGWVAAELRVLWQVPAVQIFHATGVTKRREQGAADPSPPERIAVEREIVQRVDQMIAQCPAEEDELLADYGAAPGQIARIPSAVDTARYRPLPQPEARASLGLDPAAELIVYVGRVIPRKDIRNIVRALAALAAEHAARPHLLIVGGETTEPDERATPEIAVLRALAAELGVADQLHFAGRRQPAELHRWYSAADVVVTTPRYEPFGLTPLEAMACGAPVIGADVGGISFTVAHGETGFLVPPRNPVALASRLAELLDDPALRERFGRAGVARVLHLFTWPRVGAQTATLYDRVLDRHASRPHSMTDLSGDAPAWPGAPSVRVGVPS